LNTSFGRKTLNKYLVTEVFSMVFDRDILVSRFSTLSKTFQKFTEQGVEIIKSRSVGIGIDEE